MPQLLPPVGDPIDGPGFVERGIHRLETGDEGQKAYPETQPELHDDEDRHDILLGRKPKDRLVDQPEVHQDRVGVAAGVGGEDQFPDHIGVAGYRRRIEDQGQESADLRGKIVDDPGEAETHQIANRPRHHREKQGVFQGNEEDLVMQEQVDIVFEEHELWPFHHIEGGQAQHHAGQDRKHGKNQKNNGKRGQHQVFGLVFMPCSAQGHWDAASSAVDKWYSSLFRVSSWSIA